MDVFNISNNSRQEFIILSIISIHWSSRDERQDVRYFAKQTFKSLFKSIEHKNGNILNSSSYNLQYTYVQSGSKLYFRMKQLSSPHSLVDSYIYRKFHIIYVIVIIIIFKYLLLLWSNYFIWNLKLSIVTILLCSSDSWYFSRINYWAFIERYIQYLYLNGNSFIKTVSLFSNENFSVFVVDFEIAWCKTRLI